MKALRRLKLIIAERSWIGTYKQNEVRTNGKNENKERA